MADRYIANCTENKGECINLMCTAMLVFMTFPTLRFSSGLNVL